MVVTIYCIKDDWNTDYIKNDFFNISNVNIKFIEFNTNDVNEITNDNNIINKNILVIQSNIKISYEILTEFVIHIKPIAIFLLSDEANVNKKWNQLSQYTKLYLRQYNYDNNIYQIPLGYVSGFINMSTMNPEFKNRIKKIIDRQYMFSFVGDIKSDRLQMIKSLIKLVPQNQLYIKTARNKWKLDLVDVKPPELFSIYNNSRFVTNGRGNVTLDCFRIYEAILAGSIPVIVGSIEEINKTFNYNGDKPVLISSNTWDNVIKICINMKIDDLQKIQISNIEWWKRQINNIHNKLKNLITDL